MSVVNNLVIPSTVFLVLDGLYWYASKNYLNKMFNKSDSMYEAGSVKTVGIVVHILFELFAVIYFLVMTYASVFNSFLLGLTLGGTTTSINYATVKDYNLNHGVLCTLWKGVLFALTVYLSRFL
jgi:hypothetical protein